MSHMKIKLQLPAYLGLGKVYGNNLCSKLKMWINVDKCQAGAQDKRCFMEHILASRLMIDYAKKGKQ